MPMLPPGATIGVLGGGQLGRMTAMAAARLGMRSHIYCLSADEPAAQVATVATVAPFEDESALAEFAASADVATIEFENIPLSAVEWLAERIPVRPSAKALATAQDRQAEKDFFRELDIPTVPYASVTSAAELELALEQIGTPALLKTARFGYDGKGQLRLQAGDDLIASWRALATDRAVLEGFLDLDREISIILARAHDGTTACFDPVENEHRNNILHRSIVPARVPAHLTNQAVAATREIAEELDLIGLLAVEFFVTSDGRLVANEMAPRPHNSGHWTLDACAISQFEQLVRAVSGWPLGDPVRHSNAQMLNLLGDDVDRASTFLQSPGVCLHIYGKGETRPGRKMGHVTMLSPLSSDAV